MWSVFYSLPHVILRTVQLGRWISKLVFPFCYGENLDQKISNHVCLQGWNQNSNWLSPHSQLLGGATLNLPSFIFSHLQGHEILVQIGIHLIQAQGEALPCTSFLWSMNSWGAGTAICGSPLHECCLVLEALQPRSTLGSLTSQYLQRGSVPWYIQGLLAMEEATTLSKKDYFALN